VSRRRDTAARAVARGVRAGAAGQQADGQSPPQQRSPRAAHRLRGALAGRNMQWHEPGVVGGVDVGTGGQQARDLLRTAVVAPRLVRTRAGATRARARVAPAHLHFVVARRRVELGPRHRPGPFSSCA